MSRHERHRRWCATAAILLAACLSCSSAWAARLALVIGNDTYEQVTKLRNARADAQTMAEALRSAGYTVDLKTDRTQREMLDDVRSFRQRIKGGDEVVFFSSGHGVQMGASNHLLPTNLRSQNEDQVRDAALELSRVLADLRSAKPAFTLAIIDACRDNPFAGAGRAIGGRGLTGVAGANGQMVIYAAGEGQQALDRLGNNDTVRNGVFTRVFARELLKPGQPVHQVRRNVREEVSRLAHTVGPVQVPAIYDHALGQLCFAGGATGASGPAAAQDRPCNLKEWVQDGHDENAHAGKAPSDGRAHEVGGCTSRVLRGGSWYSEPMGVRSAFGNRSMPKIRDNDFVLRLAISL